MNSLRARLSISLSLVLVAAGALLAFSLQDFPRKLVEHYMVSQLQRDADLLYVRLLDAPAAVDTNAVAQQAAGSVYQLPLSGHYFLIRMAGEQIRSRSLWDVDFDPPSVAAGTERSLRLPGPAGQRLWLFSKHFPGTDGGIEITVAEDVGPLDAAIARFRQAMLAGLAIALAALLLVQRRLLVRGLAPLDDAVAACRRIERGETAALDTDAPAEVRPMLDALNRLASHHTQRLGRIRHAVGNLSHTLKTPLAVMSQLADEIETQPAGTGDARTVAARLRAQVDTMRTAIERELHRARLAGGGAPASAGFAIRDQLGALVDALQRLHHGREIAIELDLSDRQMPLDREDMLELFGNLLDNAFKWAHSRVRLSVAPAAASGQLAFTVEDDGPGVPAPLLEQLSGAGMRVDEQRPGHGLGLAIVADIVAQYDGRLHYGRSAALGGLQASGWLMLPGAAGGLTRYR